MDVWAVPVLGFVIVVLLCTLIAVSLRRPRGSADLSTPLQNLVQAINNIQVELRGMTERVSRIERDQSRVGQNVVALGTGLAQTDAASRSSAENLIRATNAIRTELLHNRDGLMKLQTHAKARRELEQQTTESIRRLEAIIAGTQTKGVAGENILEAMFAKLPPEWQVRDFTVGNKRVEFGLRLPNSLVLPIDSKWAATHLVEQFVACDDIAEQQKLKAQIEATVLSKAKEVTKYIDPNVTVAFGVAAVPDAVYDLCSGIQADAMQLNVVLLSYSLVMPYLLLVFQTILKTSQNIDLERLDMYLQSAQGSIEAMQQELEGRFSRSLTMLTNSRNEMSAQLSKASSGLTSLQIRASASPQIAVSGEGKEILPEHSD